MCNHLETRILEEAGRTNRFGIAVSSLVLLVDVVMSRLIADLDTRDAVLSKFIDLLFSDPIRTRFDRHTDNTASCGLIAIFCLFESFREIRILIHKRSVFLE